MVEQRLLHRLVALAIVAAAAVTGLILHSSDSSGRFAPVVPRDVFHERVISSTGCTACHTPGRQVPLRSTHTMDRQCLSCHTMMNLAVK